MYSVLFTFSPRAEVASMHLAQRGLGPLNSVNARGVERGACRRVGICSAGPVLEAEAQHDKFIKHQLQSIQDAAFAHVAMKPHNVL